MRVGSDEFRDATGGDATVDDATILQPHRDPDDATVVRPRAADEDATIVRPRVRDEDATVFASRAGGAVAATIAAGDPVPDPGSERASVEEIRRIARVYGPRATVPGAAPVSDGIIERIGDAPAADPAFVEQRVGLVSSARREHRARRRTLIVYGLVVVISVLGLCLVANLAFSG